MSDTQDKYINVNTNDFRVRIIKPVRRIRSNVVMCNITQIAKTINNKIKRENRFDEIQEKDDITDNFTEVVCSRKNTFSFINNKVLPSNITCQVCFVLNARNNCTLCKRIICVRDTYYYNKREFCKICLSYSENSSYKCTMYIDPDKITILKKMKQSLFYVLSFEWLYKKQMIDCK